MRGRALAVLGLAACGHPGARGSLAPPPRARPCPAGVCDWSRLTRALDSAVAAGAASGAVVGVSAGGSRFSYGTGRLGQDEATRPGPRTIYDLASLTKVVALTTGFMLAVEEGRLALDEPVQRSLPAFRGPGKERVTIRHLLTHSAGLPPFRRLWLESPHWSYALVLANQTPLEAEPGTRTVYSDLGAIVLTEVLERVYRRPIDQLLAQRVFGPLGLQSTRFRPPKTWRARIAPTEDDPWRGRVLRGEVHDENAAWLGGVSGHAGLFSDVEDLLRFGEWALGQGAPRGPERPRVLPEFVRRQNLVAGSSRALGWDTPSPGGSAGTRLSPASFGHTGFTGTSLWIDPTRDLVIVLLSNRVHPSRNNDRLAPLRPLVADLVVELLEGPAH